MKVIGGMRRSITAGCYSGWDRKERRINCKRVIARYESATGTLEFSEPKSYTYATVAPGGKRIAAFHMWDPKVTIYEPKSWREVASIPFDFDVYNIYFNEDGSLLIVSESNGTIRLFNTETWKESARYAIRSHQLGC